MVVSSIHLRPSLIGDLNARNKKNGPEIVEKSGKIGKNGRKIWGAHIFHWSSIAQEKRKNAKNLSKTSAMYKKNTPAEFQGHQVVPRSITREHRFVPAGRGHRLGRSPTYTHLTHTYTPALQVCRMQYGNDDVLSSFILFFLKKTFLKR